MTWWLRDFSRVLALHWSLELQVYPSFEGRFSNASFFPWLLRCCARARQKNALEGIFFILSPWFYPWSSILLLDIPLKKSRPIKFTLDHVSGIIFVVGSFYYGIQTWLHSLCPSTKYLPLISPLTLVTDHADLLVKDFSDGNWAVKTAWRHQLEIDGWSWTGLWTFPLRKPLTLHFTLDYRGHDSEHSMNPNFSLKKPSQWDLELVSFSPSRKPLISPSTDEDTLQMDWRTVFSRLFLFLMALFSLSFLPSASALGLFPRGNPYHFISPLTIVDTTANTRWIQIFL